MIIANISLLVYASIIYTISLSFLYFSKERLNNDENKVYKCLLIVNIISLFLHIGCDIVSIYSQQLPTFFVDAVLKLFLNSFIIYINLLLCYFISLLYKNSKKHLLWVLIAFILEIIGIIILPIELYSDSVNSIYYSYGLAVDYTYLITSVTSFSMFLMILFSKNKVQKKKVIPLLLYMIFGLISMIVQINHPEFIISDCIEAFLCFIMYFTIENPDLKMIEQLNIAKASAEKANRAKSDFLSSMSHEIRTPLNAIVGFSEMIENENTIAGCKENAKDIVLASHTLLDIVNGILDISKIEANKMEIVNKEYSLLPELNNLAKLLIPRIGEKPIELKTQFAEDLPAIMYGDIGKIKQVITNILTNAAKYTEKGEINFNVNCINENDTCSLVISVEDTGRGIHPDKINTLFTKFNRLDEDKNTTIEGTGLGLAITKQLTEMMGGKIIVQSVYGKGSKFTIYLKQKIVQREGNIDIKEEMIEDIKFTGFKVLVVDDNNLNLKVADKLLKTYDLTTKLVLSGQECIDLIEIGEKYDLILMDDMMPKLRGPEVLHKLKEIPNFNIPVIALTANATAGIKEGYIKEGFNDYLAKPIEKLELIKVLKKYLVKSNQVETKEVNTNNTKINNIKVLIVDDNKLNIKIAMNLMKDYNFIIDEAYSGQECIDKVKNNTYNLIFMDYMMPEMDGIETLNHLKELPNFHTTLIALTADAVDGSREKFLNAGFDEYVSKPINKKMLDDVIEKLLSKCQNNENQETSNTLFDKVEYLKQNGIDVDHGLELLGDMEMYNETLTIFMEGLNERFNKLKSFKEQNDMPNYAIEVHALKSDCKYLGFMNLAELAYNHEMKSKANDIEFVNNNYTELVNETLKIFNIVKKYFD